MKGSFKVQSHVIRTKETQKVAYTKHTSKNEHIDGMPSHVKWISQKTIQTVKIILIIEQRQMKEKITRCEQRQYTESIHQDHHKLFVKLIRNIYQQGLGTCRWTFLGKGRDVLWHTPGSSNFWSDTGDVLRSLSRSCMQALKHRISFEM